MYQWNADDTDGRGLSRMKLEKIGVDPLYPRSTGLYADMKTTLVRLANACTGLWRELFTQIHG
jgi:hypothetical protein